MILLMPSRASTSLLLGYSWGYMDGIYTVSMPSRASTSLLRHKLEEVTVELIGVCQCPLGLVPPCYSTPFKNLGFMRFPEPVFAGIYQNILTTAVFRAC